MLTIQILILSDLARFLSTDPQDFLVNKTFMHFLLVHDAFFFFEVVVAILEYILNLDV